MAVNKVIKNLLFTFNFLFFLGGATLCGSSVHVRSNKATYQITDDLLPGINLLICVGGIILVLGFLGCCGAIRENRCLLVLFFLGMLTLFLMLLAVGALGVISRTQSAQEALKTQLKQLLPLLPLSEAPSNVQETFRETQRIGFCCGFFEGHVDWGNSVPDSCNCIDISRNCTEVDGRLLYSTPCMTHVMTWLDRVSHSFMLTASVFGSLTFLGMFFSLVLVCQIRRGKDSII